MTGASSFSFVVVIASLPLPPFFVIYNVETTAEEGQIYWGEGTSSKVGVTQ